ncbi:MAG: outer membrane beta-barrel protein, partial [Ignavibacteria bacterium]|nr:outer membrane beta-barrel protein [Ignavibacteria bacterium]
MKKLYFSTFSIALFVIFLAFQTNAQISFQAGVGAGYSVPMSDYGGTIVDFYNGTKYGMKSGTNFHGKARIGFLFINAFGEVGYTSFSGSGESEPGKGTVDISNKVFSMKLGPEYAINIPLSPITPYFQGFVALNTFSGSVEFQGVSGVPTGKSDITGATRIGIGGGAGVVFSLGGIKLDANIQYHLLNLAPKEYKITNVTSHTRLDNYTNLNDDKDLAVGTT